MENNMPPKPATVPKTVDWMSRKFWMTNFWGCAVVSLLIYGKIPVDVFEWLLTALVGGYLASNVLEHYSRKK